MGLWMADQRCKSYAIRLGTLDPEDLRHGGGLDLEEEVFGSFIFCKVKYEF